jgi:hypothetical protein
MRTAVLLPGAAVVRHFGKKLPKLNIDKFG